MAKKKETTEEAAGSPLQEAAKTIGETAGKVVAKVEGVLKKTATTGAAPAKSGKVPKLAKKNKSRLPRKDKKAQRKSAGGASRPRAKR